MNHCCNSCPRNCSAVYTKLNSVTSKICEERRHTVWRCCKAAPEVPLPTVFSHVLGLPCQKTQRTPIQAELGARAFYWHEETLTSVLVGCVFIPHTALPVSPPMSRCPHGVGHPGTTLDQGDESPRSMGLKRSVCL